MRKVIDEPPSATTILATSLPKAANFYIDYFVLFGLVTAAKTLANLKQVAIYMLSKNGDNTPRKMYKRYMTLPSIKWGTHYPKFVNLGVIGKSISYYGRTAHADPLAISYSCISPLILGFATISFFLVFIAFRYNMIYTLDTVKIDTQGRAFEKALMQLTTGVYLSAGCLISLLSMSTATSPKAAGPLALMVVFLACAIIYHILLNRALASMDKMVTRDADAALTPKSLDFQTSGTGDSAFNRRFTSGAGNKAVARFVKFLRPPAPDFDHRDRHLFSRVPRYPDDVHKEAYLNPAIRSETPVLWIVHDEMGISRREIEASADIIDISDYGAWFDEKSGKIITLWDGEEEVGEWNKVRKAPIYKEPVNY